MFDFYWPVTLQRVNLSTADRIVASGETNAYPALPRPLFRCPRHKIRSSTLILYSDGRSLANDFQTLTRKMAAAKITVSSVAGVDGADRELLEKIAKWGLRRMYYVQDPTRVPQIFIQETRLATETLREDSFKPDSR